MEWLLDQWEHFAATPQTLDFPEMTLLCGDREDPLVVGAGTISLNSPHRFDYAIKGKPNDPRYAYEQLQRQEANPYQPTMRFRLEATDETGLEFAGG